MSKIVVIGSSGYVGVSTISALLKIRKSDTDIVAVTRDINKKNVQSLKSNGAKVVHGDMSKPSTLHSHVSDASAVYIVVPGHHDRTRLALNALEACEKAKVKFVLLLSVLSADQKGEIFADQFQPLEKAAQSSKSVSSCIVRFPIFLENIGAQYQAITETGAFYTPLHSGKKYNSISVADVGEVSAKILLNPATHAGKTYNIVGNLTNENEVAKGLSKALQKEIRHVQVPYDAAREAFIGKGFPEWQTDGMLELLKSINEDTSIWTLDSKDSVSILQRPLTSHDEVSTRIFQ